MNDDNDRSVRSAFEDLRRSVDSAVDVTTAHARFEQLRTEPSRRRSKAGWAIGAAAAAITVLVLVGLVAMWPSGNQTQVVTEGTIAPTTTEVSRPNCPAPGQLFIYMNPGVSQPELYDVSAYLANLEGVHSVQYMNEEDTYAEFTQLFADQPDLVDSVKPGDLPTSFRPVRDIPWDEATLDTLESFSGVKQVQTATEHFTPDCVDPSPEGGDSAGTAAELEHLGFQPLDSAGCPDARNLQELLEWVNATAPDRDLSGKCAATIVVAAHLAREAAPDAPVYLMQATVPSALINELARKAQGSPALTGALAEGDIRLLAIRSTAQVFENGRSVGPGQMKRTDGILFMYGEGLQQTDTSMYVLDSSTELYSSVVETVSTPVD